MSQTTNYIRRLTAQLRHLLRPFWVFVLLSALSLLAAAPLFHVPLQDAQTVAFPLILLAVWQAPRSERDRLPAILVPAALGLWLFSALLVRGLVPALSERPRIYLSRLEDDQRGDSSRRIYSSYMQLAQKFDFPPMNLLERQFSDISAASWLEKRPEAFFSLSGNEHWLILFFANRFRFSPVQRSSELNRSEAGKWYFGGASPGLRVKLPEFKEPLMIVVPESASLPNDVPGAAYHYIGWLASALAASERLATEGAAADLNEQLVDSSLRSALLADASFRSKSPRALLYLFMGSLELFFASQKDFNDRDADCAFNYFRQGIELVPWHKDPFLSSALFNNAAVALIAGGGGNESLTQAVNFFQHAIGALPKKYRSARGARAALYNLSVLSQAGFTAK